MNQSLYLLKCFLLISFILHCGINEFVHGKTKHKKLVIFSFDGFRYDYMSKVNTPVLNYLKENGVSAPYIKPQFLTKTFPNHQSLVTGLYTENHGIIDNSVWDPFYAQQFSGLTDNEFWNFRDDVVPLWVLNEWAGDDRISGALFPGSTQPYGKNQTIITHALYHHSSLPFEERMDLVLDWLTNDTHPANLVFMYFHEPDFTGHEFGPNSPQVNEVIEKLDKAVGYLINQLKKRGIYEEINLIFVSDHGMEEVQLDNVINITEIVSTNLYNKTGSSPVVHIWPLLEENKDEIYRKFKTASNSLEFSVYQKQDLPSNWNFRNNRRVAPIVLIANSGYIFNDRKKDEARLGYHGYDTSNPNMRPFFLAFGPAFEKNCQIEPFENIDLFPLVCQLIGIQPPGNNGTFERVASMLKSSTLPKMSSVSKVLILATSLLVKLLTVLLI